MAILGFRQSAFCRGVSLLTAAVFMVISVLPISPSFAQAQPATVLDLPVPGTMVQTTKRYNPAIIRGLTINSDNPLQFDFIIDTGDDDLQGDQLHAESTKLIKYFLTSLTVSEDNMWVNLSPFEKDRIIPDGFGRTEMGRDLLAQDYLLKQLTASMIYPEDDLGKEFWERVYKRAQAEFGTTDVPVNTFNKIWIVPDKANVYVNEQNVFVVESHLRVMLEEDYLALEHHTAEKPGDKDVMTGVASDTVREVLIPEIEHEVNNGRTFANLRQIYHSMILAAWYKKNLKASFLNQIYINQERTAGVENLDEHINQKIYEQYVTAFKEGVYSYIKEEYDPALDEVIPKKYFSGGVDNSMLSDELGEVSKDRVGDQRIAGRTVRVIAGLQSGDLSFRQSQDRTGQTPFTLKQDYRLGEQQTLVEATVADFIAADGSPREELGVAATPEAVQAIRQTVASARNQQDTLATLATLKPLVQQLGKFSPIIQIDSVTRDRFKAFSEQLQNMPVSDQDRQQLANDIVDAFEALSDENVAQIFQQSLAYLRNHLQFSSSQFADRNNVQVRLQVNRSDTFNVRTQDSADRPTVVLDVDVFRLLAGYTHESTKFSWRMNQYTSLVADSVQQLIDSGTATEFVTNNPQLVQEVARVLLYSRNNLDMYSRAEYSVDEAGQQAQDLDSRLYNSKLAELETDQANNAYASLLRQLRTTIASARVREAVNFVLSKPALRERAGLTGEIQTEDIEQIQRIVQSSERGLFDFRFGGPSVVDVLSEQVVGNDTQTSTQTTVSETPAPTVNQSNSTSGSSTRQTREILRGATPAEFVNVITQASQSIQAAEQAGQRARLFVSEVLPQFVSASFSDAADETVQQATLDAVALIGDAELHDIVDRLLTASKNVSKSVNQIRDLAGEIRNNRFLRDQGIYTQVEVVTRPRRGEDGRIENVDVIVSQSYSIDRVLTDSQVVDSNGNPVEIVYLGERLDSSDASIGMQGFNWAGDTFGVVVTENIADFAEENVLWHLSDAESATDLDALGQRFRSAYRQDFPVNPTAVQRQNILQSLYDGTAIHERQHIRDGINGVQRFYRGKGMRVAQETTAYLSSIAYSNAPFSQFVKVIDLLISSQSGMGYMADYRHGQVHSRATRKVLELFVNRLDVQGIDLEGDALRDSSVQLLDAALALSPTELNALGQSILDDVIQRQSQGKIYGFFANLSQVSLSTRRVAASIAAAAIAIFGGNYVSLSRNADSQDFKKLDLSKPLNVVRASMPLPSGEQNTFIWTSQSADAPLSLDVVDFTRLNRAVRDSSDVYAARPGENILSVEQATNVSLPVAMNLGEVSKMYFDSYTMHADIHGVDLGPFGLRPLQSATDVTNMRSLYELSAGSRVNIPNGLNVIYEVQADDGLQSIADKFYGLNLRGERKSEVEWDGAKRRLLSDRILEANGLTSEDAITTGQKLIIPTNTLEYGVNVLDRKLEANSGTAQANARDNAMLSRDDNEFNKGGIDLNSKNLQLESSGDQIQMTIPQRFQDMKDVSIDGFVPVIINIVPVNNLPLILGNADTQGSSDSEDKSATPTPIATPDKFVRSF